MWVAAGVYYPDEGAGATNNSQSSTFVLESGVAIYGGFAGTETALSQRDVAANVTILSGDVDVDAGGADDAGDDHIVEAYYQVHGANALHVVSASGVNAEARLDGFTITAGVATLSNSNCPAGCGGGLYAQAGSPTLTNLTLIGNRAYYGPACSCTAPHRWP